MSSTQPTLLTNFIGNTFRDSEGGKFIDSINPGTGKVHARIPDSTEKDVELAVEAAEKAFPFWSSKTTKERAEYMRRIAILLEERLEEFAQAESRDQGKSISFARAVDIPRAIYNFRFFAEKSVALTKAPDEDYGVFQEGNSTARVIRQPVGVAGLISPWNLPLYLLSWKMAPAIAYGCTCVCKPSEFTSLTAWMFCQVLVDAHLPPGVINMVFGRGATAGNALAVHPKVPLISFTGGTLTGETITKACAPHVKKLSLELGGKNPALILQGANVDKAVEVTLRSSFTNQGEVCLCTSRILVHRSLYPKVLEGLVKGANAYRVGPPGDKDTQMGALVSKEHLDKVDGFVKEVRATRGEKAILCGGHTITTVPGHEEGYFYAPTVIAGVDQTDRIWKDEVFGPVIIVVPFDTEEEGITLANDTKYGLCATVLTEDAEEARRVSRSLQCGTVWVNCWLVRLLDFPFGGFKASGVGREGGRDSRDFFTEPVTIISPFEA
ncbi:MAG: aldehyde dehydrogenase family 8 member A1 [Piptocephalis tieghemiana]|nr:MAG: aldehyde dehydrogenase family 8 member A1 [Piptocephalis tieghemiana]